MWRALETEPRQILNGHEEGNLGHKPRTSLRLPRQRSTLPRRDFGARTVFNDVTTSHLKPMELDLIHYLTQHANQAVRHRELLQAVWGPD
jgi:DNA-binding response OmpR family regulator